jgi:ribonuclease P protein component
VRGRGQRRGGALLTGYVLAGGATSRVGITVSTAVGGAVVRNRLRRRIKGILDRYPLGTAPGRDIVLIARPGAGEATFSALVEALASILGPLSA